MKKFLVTYHAPVSAAEQMKNASAEEMKKGMEPWMRWGEKVGEGIVDMGNPVGNGKKVTKSGVEDSTRNVVGYSFLQAQSIDEVLSMIENHPHLEWIDEAEVEVHEIMPLSME